MHGFFFGHRRRAGGRTAMVVALLAALLTQVALGAAGDEASGWVDTFDNAAVDYWRARAVMNTPADPAEFAILTFMRDILPNMEPRVLALSPETARWLLADRPMITSLHEAAGKTFCYFHAPGPGQTGDVVHHRAVSELSGRALAVAAAFEFVENEEAASGVYADVLRMLDRLDEDLLWSSAYRHLSLLPEAVSTIEGFCSREPPRQALAPLMDSLAGMDRPCFTQAAYLRKERDTFRHWLLEDPDQAKTRLSALYGQAALQPAIDKLTTLTAADRVARLETWFEEYDAEMMHLEQLVEQPHKQAVSAIQDVDKRVAVLAKDPSGEGVNPLIPLLMRPFAQTYEQFVAAEAVYTMLDIVVVATVLKDFTGAWPESLDQIESFAGRTFPDDPFTGKPHRYDVQGRMAYVSTKPPSWLKKQSNLPFEIELAERAEQDAKNLEKHIKMLQAERMRAAVKEQAKQK